MLFLSCLLLFVSQIGNRARSKSSPVLSADDPKNSIEECFLLQIEILTLRVLS
jgi:hypothetical protein